MSQDFSKVSIIGGGLLGGSLAMALARTDQAPQVRLWSRRPESTAQAKALGIEHATSDLAEAVADADLLILAVPVGHMADLVSAALVAGLPASCLITDVGSVKQKPHQSLRKCLANQSQCFIGSHPMAGSEQGGIRSATAHLFQGAACLMTNDEGVDKTRTIALERFWQQVGCHTKWMSAADHDALVARISHLPHIIAAAAARVCLASPQDGVFGGGGLRDTTRVAAGNPTMWTEILSENRDAICLPLRQTINELNTILGSLEATDQEATRQWLVTAKDRRDHLNPPS